MSVSRRLASKGVITAKLPSLKIVAATQSHMGQAGVKAYVLRPNRYKGFLERPFRLCVLGLLWKGHLVLYQHRQNPLPVMYVFILKLNILMCCS